MKLLFASDSFKGSQLTEKTPKAKLWGSLLLSGAFADQLTLQMIHIQFRLYRSADPEGYRLCL